MLGEDLEPGLGGAVGRGDVDAELGGVFAGVAQQGRGAEQRLPGERVGDLRGEALGDAGRGASAAEWAMPQVPSGC